MAMGRLVRRAISERFCEGIEVPIAIICANIVNNLIGQQSIDTNTCRYFFYLVDGVYRVLGHRELSLILLFFRLVV